VQRASSRPPQHHGVFLRPAAPRRRGLLPPPALPAGASPCGHPRRCLRSPLLAPPGSGLPCHGLPRPPRRLAAHPPPSEPRLPAPHCAPRNLPLVPARLLPHQGCRRARIMHPPLRLQLPAPRPPLRPGTRVWGRRGALGADAVGGQVGC
jgi:hypothetical protein